MNDPDLKETSVNLWLPLTIQAAHLPIEHFLACLLASMFTFVHVGFFSFMI